jgi:hypothetical protein
VQFIILLTISCGKREAVTEINADESGRSQEELLQSFQVADASKLPECKQNREGAIAFIKETRGIRICENGEWKEIDSGLMTQTSSSDKCYISKAGNISSVVCGTNSVQIQDGIASNGTACSVSKIGAIATLTCGQSSVTITDGAQGSQGTQGTTGQAGLSGVSCSVTKASQIATVLCGSQSVQVFDGAAGTGCSVTKLGSVATVVCGSQTVTLTDGLTGSQGATGATGASGMNGFNSLVDFASEPAGTNCIGGGTKFLAGLDNGDGASIANNNSLEAGEVDSVKYLCRDPSSFAVAGQRLVSGGTTIATIEKRFQTWKKDYNTYFLIPGDEIFLLSNSNQTEKTLHRAARANNTSCSGRVGDIYSVYETCTDFEAALTALTETSGFSILYPNANCTGAPVLVKTSSFYVHSNPVNRDQSAFLNFVASLGSNVHFKNGTSWIKLTNTTASNYFVKSGGSPGSCGLVCSNSDYCSDNGPNNGVTISGYPFATATELSVGIPMEVPAGWKTY